MEFLLPGKPPRKDAHRFFSAVIAALLFCLAPSASGAEHTLSFDLGYLGTGLKNNGWGLGVSYEAALLSRLAVKGGFSHMTMMPKDSGMTVTTVGIQLEALCYPFGRGLDWLYVGAGCGTDFLMYKGDGLSDSERKNTLISLFGEVGWKQDFLGYIMTDAFIGYRHPLSSGSNAFSREIMRQGLEYGIRVKLNIPAIFRFFFRRNAGTKSAVRTEFPEEENAPPQAESAEPPGKSR